MTEIFASIFVVFSTVAFVVYMHKRAHTDDVFFITLMSSFLGAFVILSMVFYQTEYVLSGLFFILWVASIFILG